MIIAKEDSKIREESEKEKEIILLSLDSKKVGVKIKKNIKSKSEMKSLTLFNGNTEINLSDKKQINNAIDKTSIGHATWVLKHFIVRRMSDASPPSTEEVELMENLLKGITYRYMCSVCRPNAIKIFDTLYKRDFLLKGRQGAIDFVCRYHNMVTSMHGGSSCYSAKCDRGCYAPVNARNTASPNDPRNNDSHGFYLHKDYDTTSNSNEVKQQQHTYFNTPKGANLNLYGSIDKNDVGKAFWVVVHLLASSYPKGRNVDKKRTGPTKEDVNTLKSIFDAFFFFFPMDSDYWGNEISDKLYQNKNFREKRKEFIPDSDFESRERLMKSLNEWHNLYRHSQGKSVYDFGTGGPKPALNVECNTVECYKLYRLNDTSFDKQLKKKENKSPIETQYIGHYRLSLSANSEASSTFVYTEGESQQRTCPFEEYKNNVPKYGYNFCDVIALVESRLNSKNAQESTPIGLIIDKNELENKGFHLVKKKAGFFSKVLDGQKDGLWERDSDGVVCRFYGKDLRCKDKRSPKDYSDRKAKKIFKEQNLIEKANRYSLEHHKAKVKAAKYNTQGAHSTPHQDHGHVHGENEEDDGEEYEGDEDYEDGDEEIGDATHHPLQHVPVPDHSQHHIVTHTTHHHTSHHQTETRPKNKKKEKKRKGFFGKLSKVVRSPVKSYKKYNSKRRQRKAVKHTERAQYFKEQKKKAKEKLKNNNFEHSTSGTNNKNSAPTATSTKDPKQFKKEEEKKEKEKANHNAEKMASSNPSGGNGSGSHSTSATTNNSAGSANVAKQTPPGAKNMRALIGTNNTSSSTSRDSSKSPSPNYSSTPSHPFANPRLLFPSNIDLNDAELRQLITSRISYQALLITEWSGCLDLIIALDDKYDLASDSISVRHKLNEFRTQIGTHYWDDRLREANALSEELNIHRMQGIPIATDEKNFLKINSELQSYFYVTKRVVADSIFFMKILHASDPDSTTFIHLDKNSTSLIQKIKGMNEGVLNNIHTSTAILKQRHVLGIDESNRFRKMEEVRNTIETAYRSTMFALETGAQSVLEIMQYNFPSLPSKDRDHNYLYLISKTFRTEAKELRPKMNNILGFIYDNYTIYNDFAQYQILAKAYETLYAIVLKFSNNLKHIDSKYGANKESYNKLEEMYEKAFDPCAENLNDLAELLDLKGASDNTASPQTKVQRIPTKGNKNNNDSTRKRGYDEGREANKNETTPLPNNNKTRRVKAVLDTKGDNSSSSGDEIVIKALEAIVECISSKYTDKRINDKSDLPYLRPGSLNMGNKRLDLAQLDLFWPRFERNVKETLKRIIPSPKKWVQDFSLKGFVGSIYAKYIRTLLKGFVESSKVADKIEPSLDFYNESYKEVERKWRQKRRESVVLANSALSHMEKREKDPDTNHTASDDIVVKTLESIYAYVAKRQTRKEELIILSDLLALKDKKPELYREYLKVFQKDSWGALNDVTENTLNIIKTSPHFFEVDNDSITDFTRRIYAASIRNTFRTFEELSILEINVLEAIPLRYEGDKPHKEASWIARRAEVLPLIEKARPYLEAVLRSDLFDSVPRDLNLPSGNTEPIEPSTTKPQDEIETLVQSLSEKLRALDPEEPTSVSPIETKRREPFYLHSSSLVKQRVFKPLVAAIGAIGLHIMCFKEILSNVSLNQMQWFKEMDFATYVSFERAVSKSREIEDSLPDELMKIPGKFSNGKLVDMSIDSVKDLEKGYSQLFKEFANVRLNFQTAFNIIGNRFPEFAGKYAKIYKTTTFMLHEALKNAHAFLDELLAHADKTEDNNKTVLDYTAVQLNPVRPVSTLRDGQEKKEEGSEKEREEASLETLRSDYLNALIATSEMEEEARRTKEEADKKRTEDETNTFFSYLLQNPDKSIDLEKEYKDHKEEMIRRQQRAVELDAMRINVREQLKKARQLDKEYKDYVKKETKSREKKEDAKRAALRADFLKQLEKATKAKKEYDEYKEQEKRTLEEGDYAIKQRVFEALLQKMRLEEENKPKETPRPSVTLPLKPLKPLKLLKQLPIKARKPSRDQSSGSHATNKYTRKLGRGEISTEKPIDGFYKFEEEEMKISMNGPVEVNRGDMTNAFKMLLVAPVVMYYKYPDFSAGEISQMVQLVKINMIDRYGYLEDKVDINKIKTKPGTGQPLDNETQFSMSVLKGVMDFFNNAYLSESARKDFSSAVYPAELPKRVLESALEFIKTQGDALKILSDRVQLIQKLIVSILETVNKACKNVQKARRSTNEYPKYLLRADRALVETIEKLSALSREAVLDKGKDVGAFSDDEDENEDGYYNDTSNSSPYEDEDEDEDEEYPSDLEHGYGRAMESDSESDGESSNEENLDYLSDSDGYDFNDANLMDVLKATEESYKNNSPKSTGSSSSGSSSSSSSSSPSSPSSSSSIANLPTTQKVGDMIDAVKNLKRRPLGERLYFEKHVESSRKGAIWDSKRLGLCNNCQPCLCEKKHAHLETLPMEVGILAVYKETDKHLSTPKGSRSEPECSNAHPLLSLKNVSVAQGYYFTDSKRGMHQDIVHRSVFSSRALQGGCGSPSMGENPRAEFCVKDRCNYVLSFSFSNGIPDECGNYSWTTVEGTLRNLDPVERKDKTFVYTLHGVSPLKLSCQVVLTTEEKIIDVVQGKCSTPAQAAITVYALKSISVLTPLPKPVLKAPCSSASLPLVPKLKKKKNKTQTSVKSKSIVEEEDEIVVIKKGNTSEQDTNLRNMLSSFANYHVKSYHHSEY